MKRYHNLLLISGKVVYVFIVQGLLYSAFSSYVYDDPFITYRYAENLRQGLGFVYNLGAHVLSTTTPLFALLLALLGNLWIDVQQLANFIGAFSVALGGLLLWELGQTWKTPLVGWSGLLLYPTFPLLLITLGSETPLFLAFVLGTFLLYARQHYGGAILLITLAILTRSDGVLVSVLLGVHYIWVNRNQFKQPAFWRGQPWFWHGITIGLLLIWHGFAWYYFGAPLPITLAAKQAQGRMAISQHFAPGVLRVAGWYSGGWQYWVELGLLVIGMFYSILINQRWLLILTWTGLYFLAYTLLGVTSYFWYYAPLVPGWVIGVGLGTAFLSRLPLPGSLRDTPVWSRVRSGLVGLLLLALFVAQVINIQKMSQHTDPRYAIYRAVGEWLADNTPVDAKVGALEVGIIGFYAQRSMVDFAGLIQPEVAALMEMDTTYDDTAVWALQTYQPEYLVLIPDPQTRVKSKVIEPYCDPVRRFSGSDYNFGADIQVYLCRFN